jgi:predicted permease
MKRFFQLPWRTARRIADEADSEFRFHMDARTERLVAQGLSPDAARAQALREFGDLDDARRYVNTVDRQAEASRRRRDWMGEFVQDLTYAVRKLRNAPTFTVAVIFTLAVGIGANTAVLNLTNAALLKPPQVGDPHDLAWLTPRTQQGRWGNWSMPDVTRFREQSKSWSGIFAFAYVQLTLNDGTPERLNGQAVSGSYFDVLRIRPTPGRGFFAYEDTVGTPALAVVLGHTLWQRRFAGDSGVVGSDVTLNSRRVRVVGVAPAGFSGVRIGDEPDFWVPFATITQLAGEYAHVFRDEGSQWLRVVGRLAPGVSLEQAQTDASVLQARLEPDITVQQRRRTIDVSRMRSAIDPGNRAEIVPVFTLIMIVPLLVLAVACANVANLFLSRSVIRQKELAMRRALGASRGRLVRQLLTECVVLGLAAGIAGVLMSYALTAIIIRVGAFPPDIVAVLKPDLRVLMITLAIALGTGVVFGLLPALAATRQAITTALKGDGTALEAGRGRHRLRNAFVVTQVAMSLALLITAGLFVGSVRKALDVDPGFDSRNTVAAEYDLTGQRYDSARRRRFHDDVVARALAQPGVEGAAVVEVLPLSGSSSSTRMRRESDAPDADRFQTLTNRVTPGYFATMKMPIVQGRGFMNADNAESPRVMVINEQLASLLWPGEDPIGKRVRSPYDDSTLVTVIGVARNGKYRSIAESQLSAYWVSSAQFPLDARGELVVRARGGTANAAAAAREALREMDPTLPIPRLETLDAYIAKTIDRQRAGAAMLAVFGTLALALAAFGIFAVIAQGVAARRREIGIRMSLGARAADVVGTFVREGLVLTTIGAALGITLSLVASKALASLLFGLAATDALTFVSATVALVAVAALASFVPARRAARVDPLIALRSD